jgi:CRISPR/Cas system endoribonuclease Cas6 (RAMP superfamily)
MRYTIVYTGGFDATKTTVGRAREPFRVPRHYNYPLQSLIYRYLDEHLATQLHDVGFGDGAKRFKFFTFSRLIGNSSRQATSWSSRRARRFISPRRMRRLWSRC